MRPSLAYNKKFIILILIVAFGIILYFFNPESTVWFPKCPFKLLTGYDCPACGVQRCAYHVFHFNFAEAFHYNPFLVVSLPYAALLIWVTWIVSQNRATNLRRFCYHPIVVRTYMVLTVFWWIARNI